MSRRKCAKRKPTLEERLLAVVDRESPPEVAAAVRLAPYEETGLVLFFGWYSAVLARAGRPLRRSRWWADTPLEVITSRITSVSVFGLWPAGLRLEAIEELGVRVVEMEDEQLAEVFEKTPVGGWVVLSRSPKSLSWVVGVYGEEPGDIEWITYP